MEKNINEYINKFIDSYHNDKNGRYRSYDHCRESFLKYKNDETMYNYITLNLYAYLASWGMLRNSFLMQKFRHSRLAELHYKQQPNTFALLLSF